YVPEAFLRWSARRGHCAKKPPEHNGLFLRSCWWNIRGVVRGFFGGGMARQPHRGSSLLLFATAFALAGCYTGPYVNGSFSRAYTRSEERRVGKECMYMSVWTLES